MLGILLQRLGGALRDRQGAVMVDWIVLTSAVIALVFSVGGSFSAELSEIAAAFFDHAADGIEDMQ
jgi:hypothetical protein